MGKINLYDVYGDYIKSKNVEITDIKEDAWGLSLNIQNLELTINPSGISLDPDIIRSVIKKFKNIINLYNEINLSVEDEEKTKDKKGHHYILYSIISPELKKIEK